VTSFGTGQAAPGDTAPVVELPGDVDPAVVAVLTAAVHATWRHPRAAMVVPDRMPAWRFSGRWWSRPATVRRDRPWT